MKPTARDEETAASTQLGQSLAVPGGSGALRLWCSGSVGNENQQGMAGEKLEEDDDGETRRGEATRASRASHGGIGNHPPTTAAN
jgi:hypothetical protein